jgi:hypothetical protein
MVTNNDKLFDKLKKDIDKNLVIYHSLVDTDGIIFRFKIKGVHIDMFSIKQKRISIATGGIPFIYYGGEPKTVTPHTKLEYFNKFINFYGENVSLNRFEVARLWDYSVTKINEYIKQTIRNHVGVTNGTVFYDSMETFNDIQEKINRDIKERANNSSAYGRFGVDLGNQNFIFQLGIEE